MSAPAELATGRVPVAGRRLTRLLAETCAHVPVYRDLWALHGLASPSGRDAPDLERYPLIDRQTLAAATTDGRRDRRWPGALLRAERSGGSTGAPLEVPIDPLTHLRRQARFLRALSACGYRPPERLLMLGTRATGRHPVLPGAFCVDLRAGGATAARIYRQMRPRLVYGPLNALLMLAEALGDRGPRVTLPKAVISTAEDLPEARREALHRVFGSDPADFFGATEAGLVAFRRPGVSRFEAAARALHLELLPVPGLALKRLVLTECRRGVCMPLVRYDTGDLVEVEGSADAWSITGFRGRRVDCLVAAGGGVISPYRASLFLESLGGVARYQVIQRPDLSVDVHVGLAAGATAPPRAAVVDGLGAMLGGVPVRVHHLDAALTGVRRKARSVRSEAEVCSCAS